MLKFEYCEQCKKKERDTECQYESIITDIFGEMYQHKSCPDQKHRGQSNVDMVFINSNDDTDTIEVEHKSINIGFKETNNISHDKFMNILQSDLTEIIDSCIALQVSIEVKKYLSGYLYIVEIKDKLFPQIKSIDLDESDFPIAFENDYCKIVIDYIPEEFRDEHLVFAVSNPPINGKPKEITLLEIQNRIFDVTEIVNKINDYLSDEKVKKKYIINKSTKVMLFIIKYGVTLDSFVGIYDQINQGTLFQKLIEVVGENIISHNFFDKIIVGLDSIEKAEIIYTTF